MSIKLVESEILRFLASPEPEVTCITGRWGVGKTFAWNKYLRGAKDGSKIGLKRYSYVSLFGINSLDDFKYAIFENTVQSSEIGEPTLATLEKNTLAAAEGLGRKFVWFMQALPWVKNHVGGLGRVWFLAVRGTIVCVDDIERRGDGLSVRDIMGLASQLKERRQCKVFLILNDDALEGGRADFDKYYEKVVDTSLRFAPTAEECVAIAIAQQDTPAKLLGESCIALGISNIRLIKKIERAVRRVVSLLDGLDDEVLKTAVKSLTLFGWSVYEPDTAPSVEYLKSRIPANVYGPAGNQEVSPIEAAWNAQLDAYGFTTVDDFDLDLLNGIRNGFFDSDVLTRHAKELNERVTAARRGNSFIDAWRPYHDSFDNNGDQVIEGISRAFRESVRSLSPMDLNGTVTLFKKLGKTELATEMINLFVTSHSDNRKIFDLDNFPFADRVDDHDVINALNAKRSTFKDERGLATILLSFAHGWNNDDITIASIAPMNTYYEVFKETRGAELRKLLDACLQFDRLGNATESMKEISRHARVALQRIGEESDINAARVGKFGIRVANPVASMNQPERTDPVE